MTLGASNLSRFITTHTGNASFLRRSWVGLDTWQMLLISRVARPSGSGNFLLLSRTLGVMNGPKISTQDWIVYL